MTSHQIKISVQVKPRSKKEGVEKRAERTYCVRVSAAPVDGQANERVRELLSEYFDVSQSSVRLVSGLKSKIKIWSVDLPAKDIDPAIK